MIVLIFANVNSGYASIMRPQYMVQNTVKINKNIKKYLLYDTTGVSNNYLILINSQIHYQIIFEWYYIYNEIIVEKLWNTYPWF